MKLLPSSLFFLVSSSLFLATGCGPEIPVGGSCASETPAAAAVDAAPVFTAGYQNFGAGSANVYYAFAYTDDTYDTLIEVCADDANGASGWINAPGGDLADAPGAPSIAPTNETSMYFEFQLANGMFERVHKCSYLDRGNDAIGYPQSPKLGTLNARPLTAAGASDVAQYIFAIDMVSNGWKVASVAASETEGAWITTIAGASVTGGDVTELNTTTWTISVDKSSGVISAVYDTPPAVAACE